MAGPGGGPPRRSHTKSRKGCDTCKRRHIRCDENFPQCRNCTKHKIRCPYNDMPPTEERSASPENSEIVQWTSAHEGAIEQWRVTGQFPLPGFNGYMAPDPQKLNPEELRLIYHLAVMSHRTMLNQCSEITLWTHQIPTIIQIGASHRYVLNALLAFSAYHMSFYSTSSAFESMMFQYRGIALSGLTEAIGCFSRETSDAVLAASLVLSWQATDWHTWTQHMQGTFSVIQTIQQNGWYHASQFKDFISESRTFPTAPPSPALGQKPREPTEEGFNQLDDTFQRLRAVAAHLRELDYDTTHFVNLMDFLKDIRVKATTDISLSAQFDLLQPLRKWVLWLPVSYLAGENGAEPSTLLVIAYYYTVALLMERIFPDVGAGYFGTLTMAPVEAIFHRLIVLQETAGYQGRHMAVMSQVMDLMTYPLHVLCEFRFRMGLFVSDFSQFPPTNFFTPTDSPALEMPQMPPTTTEFLPYGETPAFNLSTEDLSIMSSNPGDSGPNSAVSPQQLSPYSNPQFLHIPSPSYGGGGGGQSPASSTYTDFDTASIGFFDHEDFSGVSYDMSFPGTPTTMLGGPSNYGVGTSSSASSALLSTTPTYPPPQATGSSFLSYYAHEQQQQQQHHHQQQHDPHRTYPVAAAASSFHNSESSAMLPLPESPPPSLSHPQAPFQRQSPASSIPSTATIRDKGKGKAAA